MPIASRITPCLWFDGEAEKAARFYVSIFPGSKIHSIHQFPDGPAEGQALVDFELDGHRFTALDGGAIYQFTPAVSFAVTCESQDEIDHYWHGLLEGGIPEQCGWLVDQFGVSWQVLPAELPELMEKAPEAVMNALLPMVKIDVERLRKAAAVRGGSE